MPAAAAAPKHEFLQRTSGRLNEPWPVVRPFLHPHLAPDQHLELTARHDIDYDVAQAWVTSSDHELGRLGQKWGPYVTCVGVKSVAGVYSLVRPGGCCGRRRQPSLPSLFCQWPYDLGQDCQSCDLLLSLEKIGSVSATP